MKKQFRFLLTISFALFLTHSISQAQTKKLIHYWHFNNTVSGAHLGQIPADYSTLGNAFAVYKPVPGVYSDISYIDNLAGDTLNQRPGYGGCCGAPNYGVRTRNPSDSMQFLWYIPTRNYQNIVIKYETQSSSSASGQHRQVFSYSIDSAVTFITAGLPIAYDSASVTPKWSNVILNLSSLPEVNNNGEFVFRMTFTPPNTGGSGNNRFDNITVEGDTMIAPVFTNNALTTGIINRLYSFTIRATGSPAPGFSVSGNPAWLTLTDSILSGMPTSIDTFGPITITATNTMGSTQQVFNLTIADSINPVAPSIISAAPTTGVVDSLFSYTIRVRGVPKPTISVSGNPSWLTLNDSILSGRPSTNGVFGPIKITASNLLGDSTQSFTITVPAAPLITSNAITSGVVNSLYSYAIAVTGTPSPELSVSGNPLWLNLNGNVLSGTPLSADTAGPVTITASNSEGNVQQIFKIAISSVPEITSTAVTSGTAGTVYTYTISATGTPAPAFGVEGNPAWLSLSGNVLSGTPGSSGLIGPVTITATNIASSVKQTFYLHVANPDVNTDTSKLIHYWHFNNTLPADGSGGILFGPNPIRADYSTLKNAALVYEPLKGVVRDTGYIDNLVGDTLNQREGFGGCCGVVNNAVRTRNPSDSMQFLWYLPTTGYKNIVIRYETQLSSLKSGQHEQIFSYSIDSGSTFITAGLPVYSNFADTVWQFVSLDLRNIAEINNNGKFVLRINFSAINTGTKGNNRFDNITVEGDSIVVINGINKFSETAYSLYPNPANENINLRSSIERERIVSVYNSIGVLLSSSYMHGKGMIIATSHLSPGLYFIKINEKSGDGVTILKFIKE